MKQVSLLANAGTGFGEEVESLVSGNVLGEDFAIYLNLGEGLDSPFALAQALKTRELTATQYIRLLRAMQALERTLPGARFFWPELSDLVAQMSKDVVKVRLYAGFYGELKKTTANASNRVKTLRYVPKAPKLLSRGPHKGYELLKARIQGHQRLTEKHGMATTYTIALDWTNGSTILVPVDAIATIRFLP